MGNIDNIIVSRVLKKSEINLGLSSAFLIQSKNLIFYKELGDLNFLIEHPESNIFWTASLLKNANIQPGFPFCIELVIPDEYYVNRNIRMAYNTFCDELNCQVLMSDGTEPPPVWIRVKGNGEFDYYSDPAEDSGGEWMFYEPED